MSESIITRVARLLERTKGGIRTRDVSRILSISRMVASRSLSSLGKKTPPVAMCDHDIWTWTGVRYEGSKAPIPVIDRHVSSVYAAIASHHGIRAAEISEMTGVPLAAVTKALVRLRMNGDICFSPKKGWELPDDEGCDAFSDRTELTNDGEDKGIPKNGKKDDRKGITAEDDAWMKMWHPNNRANRFAARIRGDL